MLYLLGRLHNSSKSSQIKGWFLVEKNFDLNLLQKCITKTLLKFAFLVFALTVFFVLFFFFYFLKDSLQSIDCFFCVVVFFYFLKDSLQSFLFSFSVQHQSKCNLLHIPNLPICMDI